MKKTLLALAIANVATAVQAGSVQLYGNIDVGVESAKYSEMGSTNRIQSGQSVGSSIGFKGTEDICEDVKAVFNVEAGFSADNGQFTRHFDTAGLSNGQDSSNLLDGNANQTTGQQLFARQAYAGLRTKFGQVTLGRQYTPVYEAAYSFDPFAAGTVGSPSSLLLGQSVLTNNPNFNTSPADVTFNPNTQLSPAASAYPIRANNSVVYRFMTEEKGYIPALKGAIMYGAGNELSGTVNSSGTASGQGVSGRDVGFNVGFTLKGVDLMASTHRTDVRDVTYGTTASNGKQRNDFYGAAYTLKIAGREYKATAGYNRASFKALANSAETKSAVTWLGATTQLGANGMLKVMGARLNDKSARNLDATQFSVGYDHKLSKRTTVYSAYSKINNKNGAFYTFNTATLTGQDVDAGFSPRAFNFGIRHAF